MGTRSRKKRREQEQGYYVQQNMAGPGADKRPKHANMPVVDPWPKIGQRLQIRQIDGSWNGGAIANVEPLVGQPNYRKLSVTLDSGRWRTP